MEHGTTMHERRKYPRYYLDNTNQPVVTFLINGSPRINLTVINISKGGLMGYTSSIEHFIGMEDHHIHHIEVAFPGQDAFRCSGQVLRVQPSVLENRCYCAIEFDLPDEFIPDDPAVVSDQGDFPFEQLDIPDHQIMARIEKLEKYIDTQDIDLETQNRVAAYDAFDDVTMHLTIEEKWLFYEMLDEMIDVAPHYPDNLKRAFLNLCRTGLRQNRLIHKPIRTVNG